MNKLIEAHKFFVRESRTFVEKKKRQTKLNYCIAYIRFMYYVIFNKQMKNDFKIIKWYVIGFAMTLPILMLIHKASFIALMFSIHSVVCIIIIKLMKKYNGNI